MCLIKNLNSNKIKHFLEQLFDSEFNQKLKLLDINFNIFFIKAHYYLNLIY
jgi:hypothetical protein